MNKRAFLQKSSLFAAGITFLPTMSSSNNNRTYHGVLGHGTHKYEQVHEWGLLDFSKYPVKDCHEMVQDSKGRLLLLGNETKNNILIYDKSGKLLSSWGDQFPGGHGLTLASENDEEYLFITDTTLNQVYKSTLDGRILMTIDYPAETGKYTAKEQFVPTEVAVAPNGDFYIADGYGAQYVTHYSHDGKIKNIFGGKGEGKDKFSNAHGICVDTRDIKNPTLIVTARAQNAFKRFTLAGEYIETINITGAQINRPVIKGENLYFSVLRSSGPETGFVVILDKNNKVISCPGGADPVYENGELKSLYQTLKFFKHPHDICIDEDDNIYIPQWNSGQTYPIKLKRI